MVLPRAAGSPHVADATICHALSPTAAGSTTSCTLWHAQTMQHSSRMNQSAIPMTVPGERVTHRHMQHRHVLRWLARLTSAQACNTAAIMACHRHGMICLVHFCCSYLQRQESLLCTVNTLVQRSPGPPQSVRQAEAAAAAAQVFLPCSSRQGVEAAQQDDSRTVWGLH